MSKQIDRLQALVEMLDNTELCTSTGGFAAGGSAGTHKGRNRQRGSRRATSPRRFTGAAVSGDTLFLSTVDLDRTGELRFNDRCSDSLILAGREQSDLVEFDLRLRRSIHAAGVSRVTLRIAAETGPYRATAASYKMEAALQLLAHVHVETVRPQSADGFAARRDLALPVPSRELKAPLRAGFTKAAGAAVYAAMGGLHLEDLFEGAKRRD